MTEERADEIRELLRRGLSRRVVAKRFGISSTRVQQIAGAEHMQVRLRTTKTGVTLSSPGASPDELADRVRRALSLAKIEIVES